MKQATYDNDPPMDHLDGETLTVSPGSPTRHHFRADALEMSEFMAKAEAQVAIEKATPHIGDANLQDAVNVIAGVMAQQGLSLDHVIINGYVGAPGGATVSITVDMQDPR